MGGVHLSIPSLDTSHVSTAGTMVASNLYDPKPDLDSIIDARAGKKVDRVILNDGHALLPGQAAGTVGIVTKTNVGAYQPESP